MTFAQFKNRFGFIVKYIYRVLIGFVLGLFFWRDKKIILFGNCPVPMFKTNKKKEQFLHNTKYLFLYFNTINSGFKCIYLCDEEDKAGKMKEAGLKHIYSRNSFKGFYYTLRAKYWVTDYAAGSVANPLLAFRAIVINCYHGFGPKRIEHDDFTQSPFKKFQTTRPFIYKVWNFCRQKDDFYIVNSPYNAWYMKSAFITTDKQQVITGYPRLDALHGDIKNSEMFLEEDYYAIKSLKEQGYKLLIYMPTWRDTGEDISGWLKNPKLQEILKESKTILICKLHPADKNCSENTKNDTLYFMNKASDVYPILRFTDGLITDYSSVFMDYLLTDKPMIYYIFDFEKYVEQCRGFIRPFEEYVAGEAPKTEEELLEAINRVVRGEDNYKERRKELRTRFFTYENDGKNCERFVEWIRSLNKKGKNSENTL